MKKSRSTFHLAIQIASAVALFLISAPSSAMSQELGLAGHYAIGHDLVWSGDQVVVTLTLEVVNESNRAALRTAISIERFGAPENEIELPPDWTHGNFNVVDLLPGKRARLSNRFVIPGDEFARWQAGQGPNLRVLFHDDATGTVGGRLRLTQTGDIPDLQ